AATVLVEARSATGNVALGSGCLAEAPGLVLTCSHVLGMTGPWSRPPRSIHITLFAGTPRARRAAARLLAVARADLALLRLPDREGSVPLRLGTAATVREGDAVHLLGSPQPGPPALQTLPARVADLFGLDGHDRLATKGYKRPLSGCSGGPLVDREGRVV